RQQSGTPLECSHSPANAFVAGFIGSPSMNFLDVTYDESAGVGRIDGLEYGFDERQRELLAGYDRESITLGIRPEDVELAESSGPETVEAEIRVVEPMGSQSLLHLSVAGTEVVASISGDFLVESGERIRLRLPHEKLHVFDPEGEAVFNREEASDEIPAAARL
ncbi:MAG: TOBE domain-containing protein, partial [Halalkalicoccus sp.]